jgi:hypothetical protein
VYELDLPANPLNIQRFDYYARNVKAAMVGLDNQSIHIYYRNRLISVVKTQAS